MTRPDHLPPSVRSMTLAALLMLLRPAGAFAGCDPDAPPDCSCGKLPVCVFSGHPDGMYSELYAKSDDPNVWNGFGPDTGDYAMAMQIEDDVARGLEAAYPCLQVLPMDSYLARMLLATEEAQQLGLTEQLKQAREAGNAAAVADVTKQIDAVFDKWGVGDLPWQDPELASVHMAGRLTGCISSVKLSGSAAGGAFEVSATTAVPMGGALDDTRSTASSDTPQGGVEKLVKQVAGQLGAAHKMLFGNCQETVTHCVTTDWELSAQAHRCDHTQTCEGKVVKTWSETGPGIGMGRTSEMTVRCCSELVRARSEEGDPEDRKLLNELWCPDTWNLWGLDLDCDGVPNAEDDTPWPSEHTP